MSTVYLIHGFIGSGKTAFAKRLEKKTGAKRFTPDEIIVKRYGRELSVDKIRKANLLVKKEIWQEVEICIQNGRDVILDYGLWKKRQRVDLIDKVKKAGGKPVMYEVLCKPSMMKQRALQRKNIGDVVISPERYDMYYQRFEPMSEDEERITIWTD